MPDTGTVSDTHHQRGAGTSTRTSTDATTLPCTGLPVLQPSCSHQPAVPDNQPKRAGSAAIRFQGRRDEIASSTIVRFARGGELAPTSRGQAAAEFTINGH
jgi:hypothetical protein